MAGSRKRSEEKALTRPEHGELMERSVQEVHAQIEKIQQLIGTALKAGEHYGVIPGTGGNDPSKAKRTLLQPGAQKLGFIFRLKPKYHVTRRDLPNAHREYEITAELIHTQTRASVGEGLGSCTTMESKYRWRRSERTCPSCGAETIRRSQFDDRGWYCFAKIGGCGAKFHRDDDRINTQQTGRKENPDIADVYNTVLKIAKKRAFVDAMLTATAAGDIFAQDLEEEVRDPEPEEHDQRSEAEMGAPPRVGRKLSSAAYTEIWTRTIKRAHETGATKEIIISDILGFLGVKHLDDVGPQYERVLKLIPEWEPGVDFAELEGTGAE